MTSHTYGRAWPHLPSGNGFSPDQYELVEVRTNRGVMRVMLFSKAIIQAAWEANGPLREAMGIKHARLRAKRAAIERAKQKG
jgi:hypothetical protein